MPVSLLLFLSVGFARSSSSDEASVSLDGIPPLAWGFPLLLAVVGWANMLGGRMDALRKESEQLRVCLIEDRRLIARLIEENHSLHARIERLEAEC